MPLLPWRETHPPSEGAILVMETIASTLSDTPGTLYIHPMHLVFITSEQGWCIPWTQIGVHAMTSNGIYLQVDESNEDAEEEDMGMIEVEFNMMASSRVNEAYEAMCQCAEMHASPEVEEQEGEMPAWAMDALLSNAASTNGFQQDVDTTRKRRHSP